MKGVSTNSGPRFFGFRCSTKGLFGVREMFQIYQGLSILCYELSKKKKKKQPRLMKGRDFSFWAENGAGLKYTTSECGTSQFSSFHVKTDRIIL